LSQQEAQLPITIHFFAQYKVSWILKWQYIFNQNCIARQFSVKWWDKFKFSVVQSHLKDEFPEKSLEVQTAVVQAPEAQAQPIAKAPKSESPKSESPTSSRGKRPTKKEFEAFALALAEKFYEDSKQEDEGSTESFVHRYEEKDAESFIRCYGFDLFQDAQDPFGTYELDLNS
jgi:hypothetical protein